MKVLGVESVNYVSRKTGNPVSGYRLHLSFEKKGCDGVAVESYFVRNESFADGVPLPGDDVVLYFNKYGNVQSVIVSR